MSDSGNRILERGDPRIASHAGTEQIHVRVEELDEGVMEDAELACYLA